MQKYQIKFSFQNEFNEMIGKERGFRFIDLIRYGNIIIIEATEIICSEFQSHSENRNIFGLQK